MGTLFVVATPIGNLQDISPRALRTLKEADVVLCEDTRITGKLLKFYRIEKPLISYHQHSSEEKKEHIFSLLAQGKDAALVTDAGTPGISDPGNELIAFLLTKDPSFSIIPIPGPSALAVLASVAGFPMQSFLFLGYPPHKKGRKKFFEEIAHSTRPVIFYESPYRILKTLRELHASGPTLQVVVGRELTKKFETVYRGTAQEILAQLSRKTPKGEFAVAVRTWH